MGILDNMIQQHPFLQSVQGAFGQAPPIQTQPMMPQPVMPQAPQQPQQGQKKEGGPDMDSIMKLIAMIGA